MSDKTIAIKLFKPGDKVINSDGKTYTVDHVHINGYKLSVKFNEISELVNSESINTHYTDISLCRQSQ